MNDKEKQEIENTVFMEFGRVFGFGSSRSEEERFIIAKTWGLSEERFINLLGIESFPSTCETLKEAVEYAFENKEKKWFIKGIDKERQRILEAIEKSRFTYMSFPHIVKALEDLKETIT